MLETDKDFRFPTHYGQVCCYDDAGYLMQTSYQPVIKVTPEVPYNPGFPMRAYEFGTAPYQGQYENNVKNILSRFLVSQLFTMTICRIFYAVNMLTSVVKCSIGDDHPVDVRSTNHLHLVELIYLFVRTIENRG
uniref:AMOP domain-containing protein n=1 Tax=Heterorhabditis bacteriophora TaxID=37862 RepID=A0A1I7X0P5_HETBA